MWVFHIFIIEYEICLTNLVIVAFLDAINHVCFLAGLSGLDRCEIKTEHGGHSILKFHRIARSAFSCITDIEVMGSQF